MLKQLNFLLLGIYNKEIFSYNLIIIYYSQTFKNKSIQIMKVSTIESVEKEIERFQSRINDLKKEGFKTSSWRMGEDWSYITDETKYKSGTQASGSLKRAALDLKKELTKITQNL